MDKANRLLDRGALRLIFVLLGVSLVIAALLGLVNHITKDAIAEGRAAKTAAAMREVLPADSYAPLDAAGEEGLVSGIYRAEAGGSPVGWVVEAKPSGFGGTITMVVGVDAAGAVTGVSIVSMSETSGLGTNALKEDFRSQFVGRSGSVALDKYGGDIDALTGATITSQAVTDGVNAALEAVSDLIRGD